jgi:hypothetical protein
MLCACTAMADTGVPQVPETQGFVTSTAMSAIGTVTETDSVTNVIANYAGNIIGPLPFPLDSIPYLAEYTSTYRENTVADQGVVSYTKRMTTDTAGMATTNLYNVQTNKVVEFVGSDTGRMTSDENSVLDGAGTWFYDDYILICPFAGSEFNVNPAFCNIVEEGSIADLTLGSLTSSTGQRYIMDLGKPIEPGWDIPVSDPGVESDYSVKLTGFGDLPAMGSIEAYINVHAQEALQAFGPHNTQNLKAEDLVYSETTSASGDITLFQKVMGYHSIITEPGQAISFSF